MSAKAPKEKFNQAVSKLRSSDPSERKQAIQWLARSQNTEAIAPLRQLYENDPDEDVRTFASKAIRYIKEQTQTMPTVKGGQALLSSLERKTKEHRAAKVDQKRETRETPVVRKPAHKRETLVAPTVRPEPKEEDETKRSRPRHPRAWTKYGKPLEEERLIEDILGSERFAYEDPEAENYIERERWEQARTLAHNAYNDHLNNHTAAGLSKLAEAIQLDPSVKDDTVMQKAIKSLMNMPLEEAEAILLDDAKRTQFIKRRKRQLRGARMFVTWTDVVLDALLSFAVLFFGFGGLLLTLRQRSAELIGALARNQDYNIAVARGENPAAVYRQIDAMLAGHSMTSLVTYAALIAVFGVVLVLLGSMAAHVVARYALRGDATPAETEANFSPMLSGVTLAVLVAVAVGVYVLYPGSYTATEGVQWLPIAAAPILVVGFLVVLTWQARLVGIAHGIKRLPAYVATLTGLLFIAGLGFAGMTMIPMLQL